MATKFSPCKGSYVLNQFPSNVMFGMNGFHVSASGAIQGHHGPLVRLIQLKGYTGNKIYTRTNKQKFFDMVQNIMGKGSNAGLIEWCFTPL